MTDNRSDKVKYICDLYVERVYPCEGCPLREPCKSVPMDSKENYDKRMNEAAKALK